MGGRLGFAPPIRFKHGNPNENGLSPPDRFAAVVSHVLGSIPVFQFSSFPKLKGYKDCIFFVITFPWRESVKELVEKLYD